MEIAKQTAAYHASRIRRTPLPITKPLNDPLILTALTKLGATVRYETARTVHLSYAGIRLMLCHNWDEERYVEAQPFGRAITEGAALEAAIQQAILTVL